MSTKKRVFEIYVPVKETWVFEVEAETAEEALAIYESNPGDCQQVCTLSGCREEVYVK